MSETCEHCCHEPTFKAAERAQAPYRGLWQALVGYVNEMNPDMPLYRRDLDRLVAEWWEAQPEAKGAFALATTRYGREQENGQ